MIRVGCHFPNPSDTTSFYRGAGPFHMLRKINPDIFCFRLQETFWSTVRQADIVFMQRPFDPPCVEMLTTAKQCRIPTWVDYDDDPFSIPKDNPNADYFAEKSVIDATKRCLELANLVTVTTEALQKKFKQYNDNVLIIPNCHDDYLLGPCDPTEKRAPIFAWRGSATHQADLMSVKNEIIALHKEFPDFEWHFLGYNPFFITDFIPHTYHKPRDLMQYIGLLQHLRPAIVFVPLVDNEFNHAKSNIAWMEATYCGATVVAPHFDPWDRPGVINYKDNFTFSFRKAIASLTGEINDETKASAKYIQDNLTLSKANIARAKIIETLYEKTL